MASKLGEMWKLDQLIATRKAAFPVWEDGNGCWIWEGPLDNNGYGVLMRGYARFRAHQYTYRWMVGDVPEGLELDHLCSVRRCCNPDHLEAVTHAENMRRSKNMGQANAAKTHCPQGHEYTHRNINNERVCRTCQREAWQRYNKKRRSRKKEQEIG